MTQKARDESYYIDDEWKRINNERQALKSIDAELDKEFDDYNAQVRAANSKADNTADVKRLKTLKTALDNKEADVTERKRRVLYDIEEVNKRSRAFNEVSLKSGIPSKEVINVQIIADGQPLRPLPYKKGDPLPSQRGGATAEKSPSKAAGSPKGSAAATPGVEPDVAGLIGEIAAEHPSFSAADFRREFEDTLGRPPNVAECKLFKTRQQEGPGSGSGAGAGGGGLAVATRGGTLGGLKGGLTSEPSKNLEEENRLIDEEWERIDSQIAKNKKAGQRLNDENNELNERIRVVNEKTGNKSKEQAEVRAWGERLDKEEEAHIANQRHTLYDIQLLNNRAAAFNEKLRSTGADLRPQKTLEFSYTHNNAKLTPLPY